ncbi:EF-hand domain-containing protein [Oscillatoria sp. CS-180]|uniref:EF-hand domain-containing protein n=1 Tax=Oscillatoria sp. CS-180 TaxID=3021720 RepID=UPI00232B7100|nr:EF-hand domain-containing protein [Oscillatoria sp. CS-180]MDB9527521.1 EF-hand domain-containing protein [Oscillatoria sp. CS-180]
MPPNLSADRQHEFREIYTLFDANNDGYLTEQEIADALEVLGRGITPRDRSQLLNKASAAVQGDLRYFFNQIDVNQSGTLSVQELTAHLRQTGQFSSETELAYLFNCIDRDGSGEIDFEEFGELMLRHRRLMANYEEFTTYFLPIHADGDDAISLKEMNLAMRSVGEAHLSEQESAQLKAQIQSLPLTWTRFIEMLLLT